MLQLFSKAAASMETAAMMLMLCRTESVHPLSFLSLRLSLCLSRSPTLSLSFPLFPPPMSRNQQISGCSLALSLFIYSSLYLSLSLSSSHCVCVSPLSLSPLYVSLSISLSLSLSPSVCVKQQLSPVGVMLLIHT